MDRDASVRRISDASRLWDIAVIGGGATGVGIAVDAASRGYSVCLFEQSDFGKGTSGRSTKLIHGGVRYLQQGNISLIREALKERGILRRNAPHLVHELAFVMPNFAWWEAAFYGIGLTAYDILGFRRGFGNSRHLGKAATVSRVPTIKQDGLRGSVLYFDGQFDDSRLLIALAQTAEAQGAALLNYTTVVELTHDSSDVVDGLVVAELESNRRCAIRARCVINATGAFGDAIRKMDDPAAAPLIAPSQGVHIVVDRSFLPGETALIVPKTRDGRVMFAIPWHGHTLIGTTDTPIDSVCLEPKAQDEEIAFLLDAASDYLAKHPTRADILSVFTGIRPLVKASDTKKTSTLSRDHTIEVSKSQLITIAGGKWTTYRKMAEDCVDRAGVVARLEKRPCVTETLRIHGHLKDAQSLGDLSVYGSDAHAVEEIARTQPELARRISDVLPINGAQVVWAVRNEMARTVDDVLSRRTRAIFLNARAAIEMAPDAARLMAVELGRDAEWERAQVLEFTAMAQSYLVQ